MAPKEVLRHASYSTVERTVTISGLTPSKKYDLEFYASRNSSSGNNSVFKNGTLQKSIATYNNYTNKATFGGLTADASGKIVVNLTRTATFTYLNGFMITEGSTEAVASVSRTATLEVAGGLTAVSSQTQDRTALKLDNDLTGQFNVTVSDAEGTIVKTTVINKTAVGITQSYISLKGLAAGEYQVTISQKDYSLTVPVTKID